MLKPDYDVTIGSEAFRPSMGTVIGIRVSLSMNVPAGWFEILLGPGDKSRKLKSGDEVSIQLGYKDDLHDIFKGLVTDIEPGISEVRVSGCNAASRLLDLRANQVYENQTAGEIVSDLAQKAGVQKDEVSAGISFPMYVVDDSKNAYEHLRELAERCGFDVYITGGNKLVFKKYKSSEPYAISYGRNLIETESFDWKPSFRGVTVQGEGAASYAGAEAVHWFAKKQIEGVAGSEPSLLTHDPVVRDTHTAEKVARAKMEALSRSVYGFVKILGTAEVKLGDTIKVEGLKDERLNGEFQVRAVDHILNRRDGFITLLGWRA